MLSQTVEYSLRAIVWLPWRRSADQSRDRRRNAGSCWIPGEGHAVPRARQTGDGAARKERRILLTRAADQISVLDVVNAVEPMRRIRSCPLGIAAHGTNLCPLHKRLDAAMETVERAFGESCIADLLSDARRQAAMPDRGGASVMRVRSHYLLAATAAAGVIAAFADLSGSYVVPLTTPRFNTRRGPIHLVAKLQQRLAKGEVKLDYHPDFGYLPAMLKQLGTPVSSQVLVFSKTSFQAPRISPRTAPRAVLQRTMSRSAGSRAATSWRSRRWIRSRASSSTHWIRKGAPSPASSAATSACNATLRGHARSSRAGGAVGFPRNVRHAAVYTPAVRHGSSQPA